MVLLCAYLFLALFVSFTCSIMESVLLSTPHSFLMVEADKGSTRAKFFIDMKNNIDKPLSAILSLNTVAHTVGAAGVGAQAVKVFGEAYFGVVSAVLTILILVITEIIPKTVGARYWRQLAMFTALLIRMMIFITYPLVLISAGITNLFSNKKRENLTSREEIAAMASIGAEEGVFTEKEHKIIRNILKLKNVRVTDIITPRVVVVAANEQMLLKDFLQTKDYMKFSRIPVFSEEEENITGYVFRQEILEELALDHHNMKLKEIKRDILIAPNTTAVFSLFEKLLAKKEHIALIVDDYGGVDGIATMEDIIESLLGLEIVDEKDTVSNMQKFAKDRWKAKQTKYKLLDKINERDNDNKVNYEKNSPDTEKS